VIFAYFAPELTLPLASALAATVGFIMLVGRAPLRIAARGLRFVARPFRSVARVPDPPQVNGISDRR
jgi:hypothetical protein